jgi:uracil-DNA glycosylase
VIPTRSHVIIEGPDGAGKTTLARRLCDAYGYEYHHEGPPPEDALHHYARLLTSAPKPTVFDRFHLGELVYGPLLRGQNRLGPGGITLMHRLIRALGINVVLCLPTWETCLDNNRRKSEMIKDDATLHEAYERWIRVFISHNVNLQRYDYTRPEDGLVLRKLSACPPGVVGNPEARYLFIGEQPNGTLDLPFFSTHNSSLFLNDALRQAGFREKDVAFTNARNARGETRNLVDLAALMPNVGVVIALGKVATVEWSRQAWETGEAEEPTWIFASVPHPQFWKRFHAREPEQYVARLHAVRNLLGNNDVA